MNRERRKILCTSVNLVIHGLLYTVTACVPPDTALNDRSTDLNHPVDLSSIDFSDLWDQGSSQSDLGDREEEDQEGSPDTSQSDLDSMLGVDSWLDQDVVPGDQGIVDSDMAGLHDLGTDMADHQSGVDEGVSIDQTDRLARSDVSEWSFSTCPYDQPKLSGRCPTLLDGVVWSPVWEADQSTLCHAPWEMAGITCTQNRAELSALSLSRWFYTRQRADQSEQSLTLRVGEEATSWSIDFSVTILTAEQPQLSQGQAFFYLGLIDDGELPGTGYPGTSTGLYLAPSSPPRFYDRGQAGANAGKSTIKLNHSEKYTFASIEGELWIKRNGRWLSHASLINQDLNTPRSLSAFRLSCIHCTAQVVVQEVLIGKEVALTPSPLFQEGDGSSCTQVIKNSRFDNHQDGLPHRWSFFPDPELEATPQGWLSAMSTMGISTQNTGQRLTLNQGISAQHPFNLPSDSCQGLLLTLHEPLGNTRPKITTFERSFCPTIDHELDPCRVSEISQGIFSVQACPPGVAELTLRSEDDIGSSLSGVSLSRTTYPLNQDGSVSSSEDLPEITAIPCDPDQRLGQRRVDVELLSQRGFGQVIGLSTETQSIQLIPLSRDDEGILEEATLPSLKVSSTDEELILTIHTPESPLEVLGHLRSSSLDEGLHFNWSPVEGLNTEAVWQVDAFNQNEQVSLSLTLPWRELRSSILGPELYLSVNVKRSDGQIFGISDAKRSPYAPHWGGPLSSLRLTRFPIAALSDGRAQPSLAVVMEAPYAFAPVIPMRRGERYLDSELMTLLSDLGFQGVSIGNPHEAWVQTGYDLSSVESLFLDLNLFYGVNFWRDGPLREVYLDIAESLGTAISMHGNSSSKVSLTLLDEPSIHPMRRCVDDLNRNDQLTGLLPMLLDTVQDRCSTLPCERGVAQQICRDLFPSLIIQLAKEVGLRLGTSREHVQVGINLTGDLGLGLAKRLVEEASNELLAPLDHISFTNNWIGYHQPLSWPVDSYHTYQDLTESDDRISLVAYNLFSGPNGVWQVRRAPSSKEARAMALSLISEGISWQRVFAWPPSHINLAQGLGSLDLELQAAQEILEMPRRYLVTSTPTLKAVLFEGEDQLALLLVNQSFWPTITSIELPSLEYFDLEEGRLQPVIKAQAPSLVDQQSSFAELVLNSISEGHFSGSVTAQLDGWDAQLYLLPVR